MIENWIDVVRDIKTYRVAAQWNEESTANEAMYPAVVTRHLIFTPSFRIHHPMGILTEYNNAYKVAKKKDPFFPDCFHKRSDSFGRYAGNVMQYRFGSLTLFWGIPDGNKLEVNQDALDKGFPIIIEMKNVIAYFTEEGLLSNFCGKPALKAGYLFATWMDSKGDYFRPDGPYGIAFKNYEEHWQVGEYIDHRTDKGYPLMLWSGNQEEDDRRTYFAASARGDLDPWGNSFFKNAEDSFNYMTEFCLD